MKTLVFIALMIGNQPSLPIAYEVSDISCEDLIAHAAFRASWDDVFQGRPWVAWCGTR